MSFRWIFFGLQTDLIGDDLGLSGLPEYLMGDWGSGGKSKELHFGLETENLDASAWRGGRVG
jgi:hypothetical protein